jgi:hypothetical protein
VEDPTITALTCRLQPFAVTSVTSAGTSCIERCLQTVANQEIRCTQKSS